MPWLPYMYLHLRFCLASSFNSINGSLLKGLGLCLKERLREGGKTSITASEKSGTAKNKKRKESDIDKEASPPNKKVRAIRNEEVLPNKKKTSTVQKQAQSRLVKIYIPMGFGGVSFYVVCDCTFKGGIAVTKAVWD